ncbi:Crp/Fnr family transcriptional regulator [Chitinophaga sp. G-6-1-13]|uniref:Crp/Fnr family transcriptional regulator n=1 Tax=Chitinophaga fulva TaxID=2728842 RepID=A0A848GPC8_9BACT|nr:Crp/Fnr family transcriptional regulator [Chitinophaga fulva]NML40356.1 Crp/Fnr family transcriptional regulator [Chitinophaga fulva]
MYTTLFAHIDQHVSLTDKEKEMLCAVLVSKKVRRRQYLLQEGDVCQHDYFVIDGCLRQYEVGENDKENIVQFAFENWWMSDWFSMLTGTPTVYNIDALEDSTVLVVEKKALHQLFIDIPAMDIYFRNMLLQAYAYLQRRTLYLQKPAEERYAAFVKHYSWFEQRVSQQHIASFLGITRETLSRLKAQQIKSSR